MLLQIATGATNITKNNLHRTIVLGTRLTTVPGTFATYNKLTNNEFHETVGKQGTNDEVKTKVSIII